MLKRAAKRGSSGAPDYAAVPWTVLGGIVAAQTEFGRYSPYDNKDRDPGRTTERLPAPNGGGAEGGVTTVGNTSGAGPGPISGVSGPGDAASVAPGHPGPPPGDLSQQLGWFMFALRMQESSGNYIAGKGTGAACGAYQYINTTWANYEGYPTACDAPPSVQDRRAVRDILAKWQKYHKWQQVAAEHFYPAWATSIGKWNACPANCRINPTVWGYVDGVMTKMRDIATRLTGQAQTRPAGFNLGSGDPAGAVRAGVFADGCSIPNPAPDIGGKGAQGSGPYLLTPAAAADMRNQELDPQNPCDSSNYVARKLSRAARGVHAGRSSPKWKPNGDAKDMENARKYWSKVIERAGIFVDRSADPEAPCAVPPPDDPRKPWSASFKIISIWRCEINRSPEVHLVTGGQQTDQGFTYTVEVERAAITETLVSEALSVSYGASKWRTEKCDNRRDDRQGIFPMTKREAAEAGVADRCDVDKNIAGAAKLVLSGEQAPPKERPSKLGKFQPMVGGWQNLGIAMGTDLELFSVVGPGQGFKPSDACTKVMTDFLTAIAPHASAFAALARPPRQDDVLDVWEPRLEALAKAHNIRDPRFQPPCVAGSWHREFSAELAQIAAGLAGNGGANAQNLIGLANYYKSREEVTPETEPVAGRDTLVIPRLARQPLKEIGAPIGVDATEAWSRLASTEGITVPLPQLAIEYAWFFGGVIAPFDSAGKLIGSLTSGPATSASTPGQTAIGPDRCPLDAPANTLRQGAAQIGIRKLCVDSVAQARTPQAAMAIKWALAHLGWKYEMSPRRNDPGIADCSSFVSRAYRDSGAIPNLYSGNAPTTGTFRVVAWMRPIPLSQARPGDLVEPRSGHVAMQLADGYKVHTNMSSDVSRVERAYTSAYWVGWVDASKV